MSAPSSKIDRRAVVARHAIEQHGFDPHSPLQVGNGRIAFNADITGLQSFYPLNTLAHWGWHSFPLPAGLTLNEFRPTTLDVYGRAVTFPAGSDWNSRGERTPVEEQDPEQRALSSWLFQNPQQINLGRLALQLTCRDGRIAHLEDLRSLHQRLDLWTGILESSFEFEGVEVTVLTCCHSDRDIFGFRVDSPLIASGQLEARVSFPYADLREFEGFVGDWASPDAHQTDLLQQTAGSVTLRRKLDETQYTVGLRWAGGAQFARADEHAFALRQSVGETLEFVCAFSPVEDGTGDLPGFAEVRRASTAGWEQFWNSGGCIDFSRCTDARATELERRAVLSQYALAINSAGPLPSQESGLLSNSWHGKFHLEMYWWHSAHYALWDRWQIAERSLDIYRRLLPSARETAHRQGYEGARWPKMIGPEGRESTHLINTLLIWQQPHPFFFAELDYREHPGRETLERWAEILFETADFMASYAHFDALTGTYALGPPLHIVSENTNPTTTRNPTFELTYWRYGLRQALEWKARLGLPPEPRWQTVLERLAPLPEQDGVYLQVEGQEDTYTAMNWEHPSLVGAYGMLPGDGVDEPTMRRTVQKVAACWEWDRCWGWDFPMMAMAAARVGDPDLAVEMLLRLGGPGKSYRANGVLASWYGSNGWLHYLPGNGGVLYAVAMMAAGWEGAPSTDAPGFPKDGKWQVRWEGLRPAL